MVEGFIQGNTGKCLQEFRIGDARFIELKISRDLIKLKEAAH